MRFLKRKEDRQSGDREEHRCFALAYWPGDIVGWLRIPSMITGIAGIVGVLKYSSLPAAAYLKTVNLPPVEFCWLILGAGCTVYLLSLVCGLLVEDVVNTCRPHGGTACENPHQWRSL